MTTYRAVVKYPIDSSSFEKLMALREGLCDIAAEMVRECGVQLSEVEEWLDEAYRCAEDEEAAA